MLVGHVSGKGDYSHIRDLDGLLLGIGHYAASIWPVVGLKRCVMDD